MPYPWYEELPAAHIGLEQGDFIPTCPIVIPPQMLATGGEYEVDVQEFDVAVLSQSCDLTHAGKITNVLVCPYYSLAEYIKAKYTHAKATNPEANLSTKFIRAACDELRKGQQPSYHLLAKPPTNFAPADYLVVDFRNVYAVHYDFLLTHVASLPARLRLLPPYREHLAQAFARFFMRVGLPQDLPGLSDEQARNYLT